LSRAHALARVRDLAKELGQEGTILMNMCGRGDKDKDVFSVAGALGVEL
jgi:tryptophan synthase beta chain